MKPKGKDFSALAARSRSSSTTQPQTENTTVITGPNVTAPPPTGSVSSRSKGKDFAAMLSSKAPVPPPNVSQTVPSNSNIPHKNSIPNNNMNNMPVMSIQQQQQQQHLNNQPPLLSLPPGVIPPPQGGIVQHPGISVRNNPMANHQMKMMNHGVPPPQQQLKPGIIQPQISSGGTSVGPLPVVSQQHRMPVAAPVVSQPQVRQPTPTLKPNSQEGKLSLRESPLLGQKLQLLLNSIDPNYSLDNEAKDQMLQLADNFAEVLVKQSLILAKYRDADGTVGVKDIQLALKKQWGMTISGFGTNKDNSGKPGVINNPSTSVGSTGRNAYPNNTPSSSTISSENNQRGLKRGISHVS